MSDIDYHSFLESTPLVPWEADAQTWHFTYVGPQAVDLLGFPVEDWYEPPFWESRIHPSDRSNAISTCMKLSAEGGSYEFEYRMVRSDGAVIWVNDVVVVEMGDTGPKTLRGFLIDITEQKALQQAVEDNESELRARQRLLQDMASALPALIGFIDKDQRYRYVNDNYAALFDVDPTQIEGELVRDVLGERLYGRLHSGIEAVLRGEQVRYELDFPASDGSGRPVELTLSPQFDDEGGVSGYVVVIFDIADRVHSREADRRHREELAHVTRVATMGELAASIAHELNQPLTAVVTNAQAARRFLAATPPDIAEIDDALEDIAVGAKRAADVIRRMRDLLRKGEHRVEVVDIASLIEETVEMLRSDAIARKVSVAVDCAADLPTCFGDPIQLKQVILNLMVNAFDVASEGDGGPGALVITASASDGQVLITFTDNGPGLPDDLDQDLFAPFVSSKPDGLGMGLTISRTLVEAHGGQLLAENNPEGGASFRVLLPVTSAGEATTTPRGTPPGSG